MTGLRSERSNFIHLSLSAPITMTVDNDLALYMTEAISGYMQAKFDRKLKGSSTPVPLPLDWDLRLLQECDQAVGTLVDAYRNPCMCTINS